MINYKRWEFNIPCKHAKQTLCHHKNEKRTEKVKIKHFFLALKSE